MSPSLRKAAILVSSLDTASADALLDQMGEAKAAQVRNAIMELESVDPREQQKIIAEFLGGGPSKNKAQADVELELSTASSQVQVSSADGPESVPAGEPFAFLRQTDGETIATCLRQERPQIAAVVLAHLPPEHAAEVLAHLPSHLQGDILTRVARLTSTEPLAIKELEQHLRASLAPYLNIDEESGRGRGAVEAILLAASASKRSGMLAQLAATDPLLGREVTKSLAPNAGAKAKTTSGGAGSASRSASRPTTVQSAPISPVSNTRHYPSIHRPEMPLPSHLDEEEGINHRDGLTFDDLARLDERGWSVLLRIADPEVALFALVGASPTLVEKALARFSPTQAKELRKKLEHPGPIKLRDLDDAREELLDLARELETEGRLRLPAPRRLAAA